MITKMTIPTKAPAPAPCSLRVFVSLFTSLDAIGAEGTGCEVVGCSELLRFSILAVAQAPTNAPITSARQVPNTPIKVVVMLGSIRLSNADLRMTTGSIVRVFLTEPTISHACFCQSAHSSFRQMALNNLFYFSRDRAVPGCHEQAGGIGNMTALGCIPNVGAAVTAAPTPSRSRCCCIRDAVDYGPLPRSTRCLAHW